MDIIRQELIQKYITLGHSEEYATREVAYFLEDAERSKQYVEMRRIAMARGNDLGIENVVQFAAAFLVGMVGSWALDSLHTLQVGDVVIAEFRVSMFSSANFLCLPFRFSRLLALTAVSLGCHESMKLRYMFNGQRILWSLR